MRCHRVKASSMLLVNACPKCNVPVTLGGGITMTNLWLSDVFFACFGSGVKKARFSHQAVHAASTATGSYSLLMGRLMSFFSPHGVSTTGACCASASFLALAFSSFFALPAPGAPQVGFSFISLPSFFFFFPSFASDSAGAGAPPDFAITFGLRAADPLQRHNIALKSSSNSSIILVLLRNLSGRIGRSATTARGRGNSRANVSETGWAAQPRRERC
mmetsp:Transcript_95456/g.269906  ORF Transcript_95456/g.269906 Transcript_95456/m.269906 type:complete len:217 (+) Transcript_95456:2798-3448(+)